MKLNILTSKTILRTPLRDHQQQSEFISVSKTKFKNDMKKYKPGSFSKKNNNNSNKKNTAFSRRDS